MTYARNFIYLAVAVAFAIIARTGADVSADAASYGNESRSGAAVEIEYGEGARSGVVGAKIIARIDEHTVYAEDAAQVAIVEWVVARFAESDLALPAIEVHYFDDAASCRSDSGKERAGYLEFGGGKFVIYNCGTVFTLLHEMAHVWDVHSLDDATRNEFMAKRHAESWTHDEWARAGGEHLADVVAWGLQDGNVRPSRTMPNDDKSLHEAFVIATGRDPFH